MTDSRRHARSSAAGLAGKVSVSVVSAVVLIALMTVFVCYRPWMGLVDDAGGAAAGAYDVSTERIEQYCPGPRRAISRRRPDTPRSDPSTCPR